MINSDQELQATMERIGRFQLQVMKVRDKAKSSDTYSASAGGFLSEIDRMLLDAREYLWRRPTLASKT